LEDPTSVQYLFLPLENKFPLKLDLLELWQFPKVSAWPGKT